MSFTTYRDTKNGPWLILNNDNIIGPGIINNDLMQHEMQIYSNVLTIAKKYKSRYNHVIDGGSNQGTFSIPLAKAHPDLEFYGFEVQRQIFYATCGSISLNGLSNVYNNLCALSNKCGTISFQVPDYNIIGNFGAFEIQQPFQNSDIGWWANSSKTDTVPCVTIDSLGLQPCFIKFDVEGMEYLAIQGANSTIDMYRPIIWAESHKSDQHLLFSYFTKKGYRVINDKNRNWYFIPEWVADLAEFNQAIS